MIEHAYPVWVRREDAVVGGRDSESGRGGFKEHPRADRSAALLKEEELAFNVAAGHEKPRMGLAKEPKETSVLLHGSDSNT